MFEVNVNGRTQRYRSKPTMNVDTTGSSGDVSIPKPLTYDYMPEGYPKKDGWSIEWDGNTEGKTHIEEINAYKISDMVLTYDDLLGAEVEFLDFPGKTILITENDIYVLPNGHTYVEARNGEYIVYFSICRAEGITFPEKGVYVFSDMPRIKIAKENITPMSYDYMPEGYPKKDRWSIEWDGNTEGKTHIEEINAYKISDMVLTYDDLLGAKYADSNDPSNFMILTVDLFDREPISDNITSFVLPLDAAILVVYEDNVEFHGVTLSKGVYVVATAVAFKLSKENITPMSTDFLPKNLNVVFVSESGTTVPTSCNVTYNELREWVTKGIPVLAGLNLCNPDNNYAYEEVRILGYIGIESNRLLFSEKSNTSTLFIYNFDGTFSVPGPN